MARNTATYDDALYWTVKDVGNWLEQIGFHEYKEPLQTAGINGKELFELSENKLRRLHPTRNMPTGRSDPASMLWKQIAKVKENRRPDRKKSKNPFSGSRWGDKRPPQAPEPDYNHQQTTGRRDDGSEEENCWGSDFSDDEENPDFEQAEDNSAMLQGNTQGRTVSYNGSSTSSFTNLSSSASGKDDDSSLYLAPNTDEDFDQTYEVPSEQMNSSYGDGDEIYDVPHDEEENNHQAFQKRHPGGGRSVSPLPQVTSTRHESLRPLPTPPPPQQASWQQQQQQQQQLSSQMLELPGRISPRPPASPHHFKRGPELPSKEVVEQENYEVPSLEEPEQSDYEAPMMEQQEEEEEEEYLVADTCTNRVFKTRRLPELPQTVTGSFPSMSRPPAPLPSPSGGPPPRPVKPPDLSFSPSSNEAPPPPIPTRPPVSQSPAEIMGFTTKVLPDPPPQTIRNIVRRTSGDRSFGNAINTNNGSSEERRGFSQPPPPLPVSTIKPPPLPKNIISETTNGSKDPINTSSNSSDGIAKMLNKFERNDDQESKRPQLAPRPQLKPSAIRQPWQKAIPTPPQEANPPFQSRQALLPDDNRAGQPQKLPTPHPTPRSRLPDPSDFEKKSVKAIPPIPNKDQHKPIKKFTPHTIKGHPELPKKSEPKEEKMPSRTEPEKAQPAKAQPAIRQVPVVPKKGDMTGYPWYDADLSRDKAEQILKETKKDGAFVVRNSTKPIPTIPYSLSLWFNNKARNLHIRLRSDGKYALGKFKENEQVFDTPVLLIQYHMTTPLILAGDEGKTCLKIAAPNFH